MILNNILLSMSFSGSIVFGLYIIIYPLAKCFFPLHWRAAILKMVIFFHLFPLAEFKYILMDIAFGLFPMLFKKTQQTFYSVNSDFAILVNNRIGEMGAKLKYILGIIIITVVIALIIIIKRLRQYINLRKIYLRHSFVPNNKEWVSQFCLLKHQLHICKKARLLCSEYCKSPITFGIFNPVVIFPTSIDAAPASIGYMMKHECIHIRNHDIILKFLVLVTVAIHWYNPLSYLLFYEISIIIELICDDAVMRGEGESERQIYSNLILDFAEYRSKEENFFVALSGDYINLRRRIIEMKNKTKKNYILSIITAVFLFTFGIMSAFAYTPPIEIDVNDYDVTQDMEFTPYSVYKDEIEKIPFEESFINNTGLIFDIAHNGSRARAICRHTYKEDGVIQKHKKRKGSCIITHMKGWRCSLCGSVKSGDVIKKVSYTTCSH